MIVLNVTHVRNTILLEPIEIFEAFAAIRHAGVVTSAVWSLGAETEESIATLVAIARKLYEEHCQKRYDYTISCIQNIELHFITLQ